MRSLRDLLCFVFGHRCPRGVTKKQSIVFMCTRCNRGVVGELGLRRRA